MIEICYTQTILFFRMDDEQTLSGQFDILMKSYCAFGQGRLNFLKRKFFNVKKGGRRRLMTKHVAIYLGYRRLIMMPKNPSIKSTA